MRRSSSSRRRPGTGARARHGRRPATRTTLALAQRGGVLRVVGLWAGPVAMTGLRCQDGAALTTQGRQLSTQAGILGLQRPHLLPQVGHLCRQLVGAGPPDLPHHARASLRRKPRTPFSHNLWISLNSYEQLHSPGGLTGAEHATRLAIVYKVSRQTGNEFRFILPPPTVRSGTIPHPRAAPHLHLLRLEFRASLPWASASHVVIRTFPTASRRARSDPRPTAANTSQPYGTGVAATASAAGAGTATGTTKPPIVLSATNPMM